MGCSAVRYCSRECQKAAWPEHRRTCGSAGDLQVVTRAGHVASLAQAQAVNNWVTYVHEYGLETLANAAVLANGGIAANLGSPRVLRLTLAPGEDSGDGGNPASAFRLVDVSIEHKDDVPAITSWELVQANCRKRRRYLRQRLPDVTVLGCIPAVCILAGTTIATIYTFPIYGLRSRHMKAMPGCIRAVCEDVMAMCIETVNMGLVLRPSPCERCVKCGTQDGPPRGRLVKLDEGGWDWEAVDDWEWVPAEDFKSRSGLDPAKTWNLYHASEFAYIGHG
ncbi:uncharacterized protein TRAVEDRAFT_71080, partial [Trametes versicolor FP-101664 SS1]|uniref:uncharacterized protein n=1 Tax=Trametes versicolor (strain FP-101664) TaxID=717944 RepID=UPI00046237CC